MVQKPGVLSLAAAALFACGASGCAASRPELAADIDAIRVEVAQIRALQNAARRDLAAMVTGESQPSMGHSAQETTIAPETISAPRRSADERYREGYTLYHRGDFVAAERAFRECLATGPDIDAGRVHFWIAETLFARNAYHAASLEYQAALEAGPGAASAPTALYRLALVQAALGDPAGAEARLRALVASHPDSEAAAAARARLEPR